MIASLESVEWGHLATIVELGELQWKSDFRKDRGAGNAAYEGADFFKLVTGSE